MSWIRSIVSGFRIGSSSPPPWIGLLLLASLLLPVAAQAQTNIVVDDDGAGDFSSGTLDCSSTNTTDVYTDISTALSNAVDGDNIYVCPNGSGNYGPVTVNKSVSLFGNNFGTAGYDGGRSTETVVDGGTSSPVDQTRNIAFTIQDDDVTIDGFTLIGNQGITLDPSRFSADNDGVGLNVTNNLISTDIVGVDIRNMTTTSSKSFSITANQFELGCQSFDLNDTQEQNLGGDADDTEGDEVFEYTASVAIRTIDGDQTPTIQDNVVTDDGNDISGDGDNDGSFYGYAIDGLKVSSDTTTLAGGSTGTIQGTAQGISILDGQSARQSKVPSRTFPSRR